MKTKKKTSRAAPRKEGRPTKYKPQFCADLIKHRREGLSFESFAGVVGVSKQTIYDWKEAQPEFLDAEKKGRELCRLWWERLGLMGVQGFGPEVVKERKETEKGTFTTWAAAQFNPVTWIFNMKNRFPDEWKDRSELTGAGGGSLRVEFAEDHSKLGRPRRVEVPAVASPVLRVSVPSAAPAAPKSKIKKLKV